MLFINTIELSGFLGALIFRARQIRAIVRLTAFDVSTEQGRSQERLRRVAVTALSSAFAKAIGIATTLISVPLTIGYLGEERYGVWMTISTVSALLAFADFGIGNGLINAISQADGKDDCELARVYVSSTFFMLLSLAALLGGTFAVAYSHVPWNRVFNIANSQAVAEAGPAICAFIGCFLISMPLGIVNRIQLGYQEGLANNIWTAVGNLLGLLGVLLVINCKGSLFWLVVAMAGVPLVTTLLNGVRLFVFQRPWIWPRPRFARYEAAKKILGMGVMFFVLQFAAAVAYSSDNIITAHILGSSAVAQYSVHAKLFSVVPMLLMMVLSPLWPAYSESITRGDILWVRRTLVRSLIASLAFSSFCSVGLAAIGPWLLELWVGDKVTPILPLLLGLAVWTIVGTVGNALAMFLNGASVMRFQVCAALAMTALAVVLKITLVRAIGLPGVIWGTVIAYTLAVIVPSLLVIPSEFNSIARQQAV